MSYFAIEKITGAVDGFYVDLDDAIEVAQMLAKRFNGSSWLVVKVVETVCCDDVKKHCFRDKRWRYAPMHDLLVKTFGENLDD